MIIVFTFTERNKYTNEPELLVDFGFNPDTMENVILPPEHPMDIGAVFVEEYGWIIND